jgi:enamine deaminase RidA (YjgF/YER057c/UK114 family)
MDTHENAPLTPKGREAMVRSVVEGGLSKAAAARQFNVTAKTVAATRVVATSVSRSGTADAENLGELNMDIQRHLIQAPTSGAAFVSVTPIISLAVAHERMIYLSGITADPARLGDVKDQTKQVLERTDRLLNKAGTDKSKLLNAQIWLTNMVRACLLSPQLWYPGLLVKIMVTAAK